MKKLIKKLIPNALYQKMRAHFERKFRQRETRKLQRFHKKTPVLELEEKHLRNMQGLPNRRTLLQLLPQQGVFAELGVDEGNFSKEILQYNQPQRLHLIDVWEDVRYNKQKEQGVRAKLAHEIKTGRVEINMGYSIQVVQQFPDAYFDCVYIDTVHDYTITSEELHAYSSKVKPSGFLAGHDYVVANYAGRVKYGVIEAVHEFCVQENWEFIYLTMETREHRSFALRRIV